MFELPDARALVHLALHILVPGVVARVGYPERWPKAWLVMLATMVVDLDHVLAEPVYDSKRCSLGFHPLHSGPAIGVYALLVFLGPLRVVAIGLLTHMGLDGLDCLWLVRQGVQGFQGVM